MNSNTEKKVETQTPKQSEIPVSEFEISLMRTQLIDYLLRVLQMIDGYWKFKYRELLSIGLNVKGVSEFQVEDNTIIWQLKIIVPEELVVDLARRKKRRMFRLPKPTPLTRQRIRLAEEQIKELEELVKESVEKMGEEHGS